MKEIHVVSTIIKYKAGSTFDAFVYGERLSIGDEVLIREARNDIYGVAKVIKVNFEYAYKLEVIDKKIS